MSVGSIGVARKTPRGAARIGWWPRLARALMSVLLRRLFRLRLDGEVPRSGPYLLVANHQGWADPFIILALFPAEPRVYFIGAKERTWWKLAVLRSLGAVLPVARDGSSERLAIEAALRLLVDGAVVAIFPEGRISRAEAALVPFQRGAGYLALKAGVPVLPVWLRGTAELYLGRELLVRAGGLVEPAAAVPTKEATIALAAALHDEVARLSMPWVEPVGVRKRWRWLTDVL